MKALALSVVVVLLGGVAVADDRPIHVIVNDEEGRQDPFPNRNFADVLTSVSEAPTGRFLIGDGKSEAPKPQDPQLEKRLDDIERKLDRVLKELKDLKSPLKPSTLNYFNFSIGAKY
jgi:hypothetical protein